MSPSTRRVMRVLVIAAIVLVPPELLALGLFADSQQFSPSVWVARMSPAERTQAADKIEQVPLEYRKALITALPPAEQARTWHRVGDVYLAEHPELTTAQRTAVLAALSMATEATFTAPTDLVLAKLDAAADTVKMLLGPEVHRRLFLTAGPVDVAARTSALSLRTRVDEFVRNHVVLAAAFNSCNCYTNNAVDCTGLTNFCSQLQGCSFSYFGCGTWYEDPCNGYCIQSPAPILAAPTK